MRFIGFSTSFSKWHDDDIIEEYKEATTKSKSARATLQSLHVDEVPPSSTTAGAGLSICKLTDIGAVLRDVRREFQRPEKYGQDPETAIDRIRHSLGFVPDAFTFAASSRNSDPIWGARSLWAPSDCGAAEDTLKPTGCNRMCDRTVGEYPFGPTPVSYMASKPVTVGKAMTCDKFRDLPNAAAKAASIDGYGCITDFPMMAFAGAGCNDDFTGVHVSPIFSKNRPVMFEFNKLHHESGVYVPDTADILQPAAPFRQLKRLCLQLCYVHSCIAYDVLSFSFILLLHPILFSVMPVKYKHHFLLPELYIYRLFSQETNASSEAIWEDKTPGVRRHTPFSASHDSQSLLTMGFDESDLLVDDQYRLSGAVL